MKVSFTKSTFAGMLLCTGALSIVMLTGCGTDREATVTAEEGQKSAAQSKNSRFDAAGQLLLPQDHHEWVFIGAPVTPNDMNNGKAAFPEFHNVYIDPASFASYKRTGEFPNHTMIVKELVSVGGKAMPSGKGYFQGGFVSLEAMVKDTDRFEDEPGGWAFFRFGEAPDYTPTGARMETATCNTCHAGATEDYVFTETYPVLRAVKAKLAAE